MHQVFLFSRQTTICLCCQRPISNLLINTFRGGATWQRTRVRFFEFCKFCLKSLLSISNDFVDCISLALMNSFPEMVLVIITCRIKDTQTCQTEWDGLARSWIRGYTLIPVFIAKICFRKNPIVFCVLIISTFRRWFCFVFRLSHSLCWYFSLECKTDIIEEITYYLGRQIANALCTKINQRPSDLLCVVWIPVDGKLD